MQESARELKRVREEGVLKEELLSEPKHSWCLFLCRSSKMKIGDLNETVEVEVILGRRLIGTFMTIYMPTILLNIIGHSTNYFKPFFFEAVVTVNLTVTF